MKNTQKKKSLFGFTAIDCLLAGIVIGLLASNIAGFAYLAAAREMNERVMQSYEREMRASLSDMPASAQLVASFAAKRAMEAAIGENRAGSLGALVLWRAGSDGSSARSNGQCRSGGD